MPRTPPCLGSHSGPLAGSFARCSETAGVLASCSGCPAPCQEQDRGAEGSFTLRRAQLGLQLLGEASLTLQKVLTHIQLFLEGGKKEGLFPACCLLNHGFNFLSYATALPACLSACDRGGHTVTERHLACRSGTKLKAELPEG